MRLIFIHIPKTGGTTFKDIVKKNFKVDKTMYLYEMNMNELPYSNYTRRNIKINNLKNSDITDIDLIQGHFFFTNNNELKKDFKFLTFIRNPVDRVISEYWHSKTISDHPYYLIIKNKKLSLLEYIDEFPFTARNFQTKILSGDSFQEDQNVSEKNLDHAIKNLGAKIFFGITELYDKSLIYLKYNDLLNKISYVRHNTRNYNKEINRKFTRYPISGLIDFYQIRQQYLPHRLHKEFP